MSGEARRADQAIADLVAKQAITEVLHRYCRALDRMDRELAADCWHPDGADDHAPNYVGSAEGFLDWVWPVHAGFLATRHELSNILIRLDEDRRGAGAESYCAITLRFRRDGAIYDLFTSGRYLDRLEARNGVWALRRRRSISEWHRIEKVGLTVLDFQDPPLVAGSASKGAPARPRRDRDDPSYEVLP